MQSLQYIGPERRNQQPSNQMIDPREYGRLEAQVQTLQADVKDIATKVTHLTAMADRSRGALWAGMGLASLFGGLVTFVVDHFLRR
ncbi:hypothetical protein [Parvibium lacunae]|uniref:Uncharacterized protein n=1 Tax=Parvibium lacunae TaxID=1888893 RepID=A0A368L7R4_9BURK|nr:hypothetical protein [Parvibium lacunae]RCS59710.1 hypothetical protein DU000_03105 [Parvibium lacunae]